MCGSVVLVALGAPGGQGEPDGERGDGQELDGDPVVSWPVSRGPEIGLSAELTALIANGRFVARCDGVLLEIM